jgi:hypothetical protein
VELRPANRELFMSARYGAEIIRKFHPAHPFLPFEHTSEGNPAVIRINCEGDKKSKTQSRDNRLHKCSNFPSKHQEQNLTCSENATL